MIDLRNTREEAISIAELKSNQDNSEEVLSSVREDAENPSKSQSKIELKGSLTGEKSIDIEDDDDKEPKYRLDPE